MPNAPAARNPQSVPPGAAVCPFHAHLAQWELFVVQAGIGTVRAGFYNPTDMVVGALMFLLYNRDHRKTFQLMRHSGAIPMILISLDGLPIRLLGFGVIAHGTFCVRDLRVHPHNHTIVTHLTEYPEPFLKVSLSMVEATLSARSYSHPQMEKARVK